ncbi:MAG: signal peptidase I [Spirochaetes bacterium]|nr:signal peptidase I [Spirochaetota bacterium]
MEYMGRLIQIALCILAIAGMWKVFEKSGKPGWAAIIPIYNLIIIIQIVRKPIWWIFLCLLIIPIFILAADLAECFGKSKVWGVFLLGFFPFIGFPILGFGDARFTAPSA